MHHVALSRVRASWGVKALLACVALLVSSAPAAAFAAENSEDSSDLTVPTLTVPTLTVPTLGTPQLQVPQLQVPQLQVPQLQVPQLQVPQLQVPQLQVPQLQVPQLPQLQVPELPVLAAPSVGVASPRGTRPSVSAPIGQVTVGSMAVVPPEALLETLRALETEEVVEMVPPQEASVDNRVPVRSFAVIGGGIAMIMFALSLLRRRDADASIVATTPG